MKSPATHSLAQSRLPSIQELEAAMQAIPEPSKASHASLIYPSVVEVMKTLVNSRAAVNQGDIVNAVLLLEGAVGPLAGIKGLDTIHSPGADAHRYFANYVRSLIHAQQDILRKAGIHHSDIPGYEQFVEGRA